MPTQRFRPYALALYRASSARGASLAFLRRRSATMRVLPSHAGEALSGRWLNDHIMS
jgi:hypothetical protein